MYQRGDFVQLIHETRTVPAMILLASPNGRSLMLGFDGIVAGHVGGMPLLQDDDGVYRSVLTNEPVTLAPLERDQPSTSGS